MMDEKVFYRRTWRHLHNSLFFCLFDVFVGSRQAEVLKALDCQAQDCPLRGGRDCLVGHEIEGRL